MARSNSRTRGRGRAARRTDTSELYAVTLADLNRTIVHMTSPRFDELLQSGGPEDRLRALRELLAVERARLVLGNAVLQDIASALKENEAALVAGRESLDKSLERLDNITRVLDSISGFLSVVGRIVALV